MPLTLNGTTGISFPDGSSGAPALRGTDSDTGVFFPSADTIALVEGGTEVLRINSSANVGIGTTNPAEKLHVYSASSVSSINIDSGNSGTTIYYNLAGVRKYTAEYVPSNDFYSIGRSGVAYDLTLKNGNVGIGITNPVNRLQINVNSATTYTDGVSQNNGISIYNTSTTTNQYCGITLIGEPTNGNAGLATIIGTTTSSGSMDLLFSTRNSAVLSEKLRITASGNVGIGTTNPADKLHVQGGVRTSQLSISTATFNYIGGSGTNLLVNGDDNIVFRTDNEVERVRITASGLVGIGTTNPQDSLHVYGGNIQFTRTSTYTNTWYIFQSHISTGTYGSLYFQPALNTGDFIYYSNTGTDLVRFKHNGNVGIGTSNPVTKLDVVGDLKFTTAYTAEYTQIPYTASTNYDITGVSNGNYIVSIRSVGTYHYNGILAVTLFDTADFGSAVLTSGNYQTTLTFTIVPSSNNHTLRFNFSRAFDSLGIRLLRLSY